MRSTLLAGLACTMCMTSAVHADPECGVTYVTAPDGIREVIEGWVAAEPNCRGSIALRVIPTPDGLFLFAERPDGTVHERLVPDLTAAGVLVASWVADPWHVAIKRHRRKKARKKKALEVRAIAVDAPLAVAAAERPKPTSPKRRWISLGLTTVPDGPDANVGVRLEGDVIVYGGWKLGAAIQSLQNTILMSDDVGLHRGQIDDWAAGVQVSRTMRWSSWELRGAVALYALASNLHSDDFRNSGALMPLWQIERSAAYELSATLHRDVGAHWGVSVTAATMYISQRWHGVEDTNVYEPMNMNMTVDRAPLVLSASFRRRI